MRHFLEDGKKHQILVFIRDHKTRKNHCGQIPTGEKLVNDGSVFVTLAIQIPKTVKGIGDNFNCEMKLHLTQNQE
jgi:hypothetical protein